MRAIKKINNNVALCIDNNGLQLVAFGKGIGFHEMPFEIADLKQIDRTFYNINSNYIDVIADIPEDVFAFTGRILDTIRNQLPYQLTPNFVITLADHIAFSIERYHRGIYVRMPLKYEIGQTYPLELKLSEFVVEEIERNFHVVLNPRESSGIALSIVNARMDKKSKQVESEPNQDQFDEVLEDITKIIEEAIQLKVDRDTFSYARFSTHLQYLYTRLRRGEEIQTENIQIYEMIQKQYPNISKCVERINDYFYQTINCNITDEEKLYLILHINRITSKEELQL